MIDLQAIPVTVTMADTPENTIQLFYDMFAEGKVKELLEACCTGGESAVHHSD